MRRFWRRRSDGDGDGRGGIPLHGWEAAARAVSTALASTRLAFQHIIRFTSQAHVHCEARRVGSSKAPPMTGHAVEITPGLAGWP